MKISFFKPMKTKGSFFLLLILTLGFSSCNRSEKKDTMSIDHKLSGIQLTGEEVTTSFLVDPTLSYGIFNLKNEDSESFKVNIQTVKVKIGDEVQNLTDYKLFDLNQEVSIDPDHFQLDANESKRFNVGFPRIPFTQALGAQIEIILDLEVGDMKQKATSRIILVKQIPRR